MKIVMVVLLGAVLAALASAGVFMLQRREQGKDRDERRMARALALRVALSVALFLLILLGWALGWVHPGGLPRGG
jgi:formate hydrogenlyase subunit 3/multisubunit Na+/H+ antiporter MnhD subunit